MKKNLKKVFVGMSGGVDSSVSAALLLKKGYDVVGVFIRTWTPDFIECTWRDERRDAMRACAHLDIPFLECDAEEAYKKGVADYMISEYSKGNTPNPDVMCNREVKFGIFWHFAKAHGADYIATGHYAQNIDFKFLTKGNDKSKDQSYFLWTLTQEDLTHILFPVGHLLKTEVRKLAQKFDLPQALKKDSQGVCFLGPLDMKEFLSHYIQPVSGDVLNQNNEVIGVHDGAVFLTIGERHGFTITKKSPLDEPYYVISKDIKKNTVTVSNDMKAIKGISNEIQLERTNWISTIPFKNQKYTGQIRYHGEYFSCVIQDIANTTVTVMCEKPMLVSKGQSIVIYDNNRCLGGGIVS